MSALNKILKGEPSNTFYTQFLARHSIIEDQYVLFEALLINAVCTIKVAIDDGLRLRTKNDTFVSESTWALLLSMLDRVWEHSDASLVTLVTRSAASSEVIARTTLESAVNVIYILSGDRNERLSSYFREYIIDGGKQVEKWLEQAATRPEPERSAHVKAATQKMEDLAALSAQTDMICKAFGFEELDLIPRWPNVYTRFVAIGKVIDYRTVYHALCAETHNDAEDLLLHFLARLTHSDEILESAALKALSFTRLMVYQGAHYYAQAALAYARTYGLNRAIGTITQIDSLIGNWSRNIAQQV